MYDPSLKRQLYLTLDWEAAWRLVAKPWLTMSGRVETGTVVVPTRGQARAMRSRMATEGIATVGIRYVTPGVIKTLSYSDRVVTGEQPDRAILEFGLKQVLADIKLKEGASGENEGLTQSLLSRPGGAIDDWEDLMRSGLDESSFPHPYIRKLFNLVRSWLNRNGFRVPYEEELRSHRAEGGNFNQGYGILFWGFSAEYWRDWPYLSFYCREDERIVSVVPFPSFAGKPIEERWIELWEGVVGCEALSLPDQEERENAALARGWALSLQDPVGDSVHDRVRLLVGQNPGAEMALVFNQVLDWLSEGSGQIAVVFPTMSPAVADLNRRLTGAGIRFCDEISTTGATSLDVRLTRALLLYQRSGYGLEDLWNLTRLLRGAGLVGLTAGESRNWIERVFDVSQSHSVADATESPDIGRLRGSDEMIRLIREFGFWPNVLSIGATIDRLNGCVEKWGIESPLRKGGLEQLRLVDDRKYSRESVIDLLIASLPERAPRCGITRDDFAQVVLTTRRRAEALVWSHVVFAGSNAEDWPRPAEETYWLSDPARRELNLQLEDPVQLPLMEDASILERLAYQGLCNNVVGEIVFSSCLQASDGNEAERTPHPWLERILLREARSRACNDLASDRFQDGWRALSRSLPSSLAPSPDLGDWMSVWNRRRDPEEPFDSYFYSTRNVGFDRRRWAASLLERGFSDPVILWYEGVLRLYAVDERPLERHRRKELGLLVHRLLAQALRGDSPSGTINLAPQANDCRARLGSLLDSWRNLRARDAYWESFFLELSSIAFGLLESIASEIEGRYLAIEYPLPGDTILVTAYGDLRIGGRLDLAILDQPEWKGSSVRVIDFKTGSDKPLDAEKMGIRGQALQLGVYLQSVVALGARSASVEMIRVGQERGPEIADGELLLIQPAFDLLGEKVHTGKYGQMTADRTRFQRVFETPLACVPIPNSILSQKIVATFLQTKVEGERRGGQE
jgi:hypothetical protein